MYGLKTEASFDSAHFLTDYYGKCENLHGHRWRAVVYLEVADLQADGTMKDMVVDFGVFKRAVLVFNTSNTPAARELEAFGDPLQRLWRDCICDFCGVTTFDRVMFRVVADSTPADRRTWLEQARTMTRESFPSEWNSAARSD